MLLRREADGRRRPELDSFAIIVHPLRPKRDVSRRYPFLGRALPTPLIHLLTRRWPPLVLSQIVGLHSPHTDQHPTGCLLGCPLTASQMVRLPPQVVYDRLVQTGRVAQKRGVRILGLGGFASAVGDSGVTVAQRLAMPVTTGNSLTVGLAIEALKRETHKKGLALDQSTVAVVGASGSIGLACAEMLAPETESLVLAGRREIRLSEARARVEAAGAKEVRVATDLSAIVRADVVLSATTSITPVLAPEHLKRGALVVDLALPPDVDSRVREERADVTLVRAGVAQTPGSVDLSFDLGLPSGYVFGWLAEVMVLALEGRYESFSLGRRVDVGRVREITELAWKHGFRLPAEPYESLPEGET